MRRIRPFLWLVLLSNPLDSLAQTPSPSPHMNIAYMHTYGVGGFRIADQRVRVFRVSPAITLRAVTQDNWGLKLRLSAMVGSSQLESIADVSPDRLRVASLVPGIEILLPVSRAWLAKPFIDLGFGRLVDAEETVLIAAAGFGSEIVFSGQRGELGFEPVLGFTRTESLSQTQHDGFGALAVKGDVRYRLWFLMGAARPDVGIYGIAGYSWDGADFGTPVGELISLNAQYEIGFSIGAAPRVRVWSFYLPRLSFGFRWGREIRGFTIKLGGRETREVSVTSNSTQS